MQGRPALRGLPLCCFLQDAARGARQHAVADAAERGFLEGDGDAAVGQLPAGDTLAAAEEAYAAELAKEVRAAKRKAREGEEEEETEAEEEGGSGAESGGAGGGSAVAAPPLVAPMAPEEEMAAMKDIMMPRKKRKLYERIKRAQEGQRERASALEARKEALQRKRAK